MNNLFLPIILGTGREGRRSEHVARYVLEQAQAYGLVTKLIDVRDFTTNVTIPSWDEENEKAVRWRAIAQRADGFIIVSPEYNHGYPGELKMLLDKAEDEYARKPVAICGVGGMMGGGRMVEMLRIALIELQMVPIRNSVYFMNIKALINERGSLMAEGFAEPLATMFDELVWYAEALKAARTKV